MLGLIVPPAYGGRFGAIESTIVSLKNKSVKPTEKKARKPLMVKLGLRRENSGKNPSSGSKNSSGVNSSAEKSSAEITSAESNSSSSGGSSASSVEVKVSADNASQKSAITAINTSSGESASASTIVGIDAVSARATGEKPESVNDVDSQGIDQQVRPASLSPPPPAPTSWVIPEESLLVNYINDETEDQLLEQIFVQQPNSSEWENRSNCPFVREDCTFRREILPTKKNTRPRPRRDNGDWFVALYPTCKDANISPVNEVPVSPVPHKTPITSLGESSDNLGPNLLPADQETISILGEYPENEIPASSISQQEITTCLDESSLTVISGPLVIPQETLTRLSESSLDELPVTSAAQQELVTSLDEPTPNSDTLTSITSIQIPLVDNPPPLQVAVDATQGPLPIPKAKKPEPSSSKKYERFPSVFCTRPPTTLRGKKLLDKVLADQKAKAIVEARRIGRIINPPSPPLPPNAGWYGLTHRDREHAREQCEKGNWKFDAKPLTEEELEIMEHSNRVYHPGEPKSRPAEEKHRPRRRAAKRRMKILTTRELSVRALKTSDEQKTAEIRWRLENCRRRVRMLEIEGQRTQLASLREILIALHTSEILLDIFEPLNTLPVVDKDIQTPAPNEVPDRTVHNYLSDWEDSNEEECLSLIPNGASVSTSVNEPDTNSKSSASAQYVLRRNLASKRLASLPPPTTFREIHGHRPNPLTFVTEERQSIPLAPESSDSPINIQLDGDSQVPIPSIDEDNALVAACTVPTPFAGYASAEAALFVINATHAVDAAAAIKALGDQGKKENEKSGFKRLLSKIKFNL